MADTALPSWGTLSSDPEFQKLTPDERIDALDSWRDHVAAQAPLDATGDVLESLNSYANQQRAILSAASSTMDVARSLRGVAGGDALASGAISDAASPDPSVYGEASASTEVESPAARERRLQVPYPDDLSVPVAGDVERASSAEVTRQRHLPFEQERTSLIDEANRQFSSGVKVRVDANNVIQLEAPPQDYQRGDDEAVPDLRGKDADIFEELRTKLQDLSKRSAEAGAGFPVSTARQKGAELGAGVAAVSQTAGALMDQAAGALGSLRMSGVARNPNGLEGQLASGAAALKEGASGVEGPSGEIARGAGNVTALMAGNPAGGLGLIVGALRAGSEAYSSTLTATGSEQEATRAAALTAPMMLAYMGAGKIAAGFASRIAGQEATALSRSLLGFAGAEVANVGTSAVIRALEAPEGKRLEAAGNITLENLTADTLMAAIHGVGEYRTLPPEVKASARAEAERRGFIPDQLQEPPIEGEFTILPPEGEAPATALLPAESAPREVAPKERAAEEATQQAQTTLAETGKTETAAALAEVERSTPIVPQDGVATAEVIPAPQDNVGSADAVPEKPADQTPAANAQPVQAEAQTPADQIVQQATTDAAEEGHVEQAPEVAQQVSEPAPESTAEVATLTPEQYDALNYSVRAAADRFTWRNEAERDSNIATVLSEVERRAGQRVAQRGNLEGFAPSVVAMSRFRDILRKAETQRTGNIEPVSEGEAPSEPVAEAPDPAELAAQEDTNRRVRGAVSALGGDEGRLLQYHLDNPGTSLAQAAEDLGIQEDRARRLYAKAAAKLRSQLKADHDAMLQLAIIPGLQEFIQQDVLTAASGLLGGVAKAFQDTRSALAPASFGGTASITAGAGREQLAIMARKYEMAAQALKGAQKMFDRLPDSLRLEFIDRVETGKAQPTAELGAIAKQLRDAFAERVRQVRALNPKALKNLITDYFPHIWEDPNAATNWYQRTFGRRPFEGSKDFIKHRTIPTTMDGINAGLKPVSTNPIELTLLKLREIDRYVMAHQWARELKQQGIMQYVPQGSPVPTNWVKVDDRMAQAWQKNPDGHGMILHGQWYAPAEAARILNNYLSPGLKGYALYDGIRGLGNALNQVQLGMSMFHMFFVSLDSATSKAALGVVQMGRGRVLEGMFNFSKGVLGSIFTNPIETFWKGSKVLQEYYQPRAVGGEVGQIVEALVRSGGRVKMDSFFQTGALQSFFKALRSGNYPGAGLRAPFAIMDALSHPLLNYLVPRMKMGVFYDMAREELADLRARGITDLNGVREALDKVWDSVDNRMGQLVYDNLFWNRLLKDSLMAGVRSVGWNLGDIRELGGGAVDTITLPWRVKNGGASRAITHRMGYLIALPFSVGLLGGLVMYMLTGRGPGQRRKEDGTYEYAGTGEAIRDMMMPQTGKRLPDGSDERIVLPSYMKDLKAYATHPLQTLSHKTNPAISMVVDMLSNHDYYGTEIVNEGDPLVTKVKDWAEFVAKQFRPFTFQAMGRREGDDLSTKLQSFVGLQPPPANLLRTPAMNKLMEFARNHMPSIRTAADTTKQDAAREAKKEARRGLFGQEQPTTFPELRRAALAALDEKMISTRDYAQLNSRIANRQFGSVPDAIDFLAQRADPRIALFKRLSPEEGARVLRLADPEEAGIWNPLMDKKLKASAKTEKREAARSNARRAALGRQEASVTAP